MTLRNPFANPHYLAGSVLARLAVNAATLIWAIVLLAKDDALATAPTTYAWITEYAHENLIAGAFGALSLTQIVWLFAHWPPIRIRGIVVCGVGYGILAAAWSFVLFNILLGPRPIQPTSTAWVSVGVALSLFAFVSNARDESDGGSGS